MDRRRAAGRQRRPGNPPIETLAAGSFDRAVILTSFHQSALPTALLLRLAGVQSITAISEDYAGSLLDKRVAPDWSLHEVDRALQVANAAGFAKPAHDNGGLALRQPLPPVGNLVPRKPYVVLHPGTSVPARAWPAEKFGATAQSPRARGTEVVVTGSANERAITTSVVTGSDAVDLTGRTDLPHLASVLAGAEAVVIANTGPAHLAAAVGTPVVSLFAPTVSAQNWGPYGVPSVVLGDQGASCRGSRARVCPVPGHPCLGQVDPKLVLVAIEQLAGARTDPRWDRREPA